MATGAISTLILILVSFLMIARSKNKFSYFLIYCKIKISFFYNHFNHPACRKKNEIK